MHLGAVLERHGGIVHGRGAGAQHGDGPPAQPLEVDDLAGVGAAVGRQGAHEVGHPPFAGAVLAGGQHQLARRQHLAGRQRDQQAASAIVELGRRDRRGGDAIAHRQLQHAAVPLQIVVPGAGRYQTQAGEASGAVRRVVPRLEGEARDAEVGACLVLGAAQGRHAGETGPDPFPALRRAIDHQDVAHAIAHQREGDAQARLAGAHDQYIERRLALVRPGRHPVHARMRRHLDVPPDPGFEGRDVACAHGTAISKPCASSA